MYGSLPRPGFTGPLRAHDPARHSLSGPARNHLPGHVPSSGSRTVLTLRLGIPDHGSPFDHFVARPLLSGGAQCPGPDSDGPDTTVTSPSRSGRAPAPGPDSFGPGLIMARLSPLTAQRHGVQRARMLLAHRVKPLAKPIVDVPKRHPAGAGAFHLDVTTTGRAAARRRGRGRARQLPRPDHSSLVAPQPPRSTRGHLDSAEPSAGGEGLPQTTPLLSRRGCKWGSNPLSSMNNQSTKLCHVSLQTLHHETHPRVEVRVAAAVSADQCGGF